MQWLAARDNAVYHGSDDRPNTDDQQGEIGQTKDGVFDGQCVTSAILTDSVGLGGVIRRRCQRRKETIFIGEYANNHAVLQGKHCD